MKNKNLILTGWSKPGYVAAAAAALEALGGKADVAGVSMDALATTLGVRGQEYSAVYVLGVGLVKNIAAILESLKALKKKRVKTVWLSGMPVAPEFEAEVRIGGAEPSVRGFDELVDAPSECLVDVVARYFGNISPEDVRFYRAYEAQVVDRGSAVGRYQMLAMAAGFMHRTRMDDSIYEGTIRSLYERVRPDLWDKRLKEAFEDYVRFGRRELVGTSKEMADVRMRILLAARHERARVLILGESGTGKETVATQIHANSPRKNGRFVAFNCASVAPNLLEDRFFGHEKGAFTGADRQTKGLFEQADHGTLFLDEIAEMPLDAQALLLRALEGGKIIRVGGAEEVDVDVRLVAATNKSLPKMVREGKFRADLYQRISTIVVQIPPLRGRREDIIDIADGWWLDMGWGRLSKKQLEALTDYDYPGNVRELINILDRARALDESDFKKLIREHKAINSDLRPEDSSAGVLPDNLAEAMRLHVRSVFEKHGRSLAAAKSALGISLNTLKKYLGSCVNI